MFQNVQRVQGHAKLWTQVLEPQEPGRLLGACSPQDEAHCPPEKKRFSLLGLKPINKGGINTVAPGTIFCPAACTFT